MNVGAIVRPRRTVLRAVIEDARRHARRRRLRYLLVVLLGAAGAVVAYSSVNSSSTSSSLAEQPIRIDRAAIAPLPHNGPLTLMAAQENARDEGPAGWYGISSVGPRGGLRTLVRCPHRVRWCGDLESIDWSRDGTRLAFGVTSVAADNPYNGLHVVDVRSGRDSLLVRSGEDGEYNWFDVDWAPNGRRLAYSTNGHIAVINVDGSSRRILRTGTVGHDHSPSWSPDGRWIAFSSRLHGVSALYVIRADGFGRRLLAHYGATPAWSPDGSRIAFRGRGGVEFVTANGRVLTPRPPFRPGVAVGVDAPPLWSPDGKKIAMSKRRDGTWVMNADGTRLRRLTRYSADSAGFSQRPRAAWRPRS